MGLDNIPNIVPCKKAGTAVMRKTEDGLDYVDCDETIACGGCTYKEKVTTDPLVKNSVPVYGMFGNPCWYRGKYGNTLLQLASDNGFTPPLDFYGTGEAFSESEGLDEIESMQLSNWMADHTEKFTYIVKSKNLDPRLIDDWIYACWWLKFVSNFGEGSAVWY